QLAQTQSSVEGVRRELQQFNEVMQQNTSQLAEAEESFRMAQGTYEESQGYFNEFNLNVTRQQSKVNALKQELTFKSNQLEALQKQVEQSTQQLSGTNEDIAQNEAALV